MRRKLSLLPLVLLAPLLGSCVWFGGDSRIFVSSDPQGAKIWIDGKLSQQTTPAALELGGILGSTHEIRVGKKGFEDEVRTVSHYTQFDTTKLNEWVGAVDTLPFPTWATFDDLIFPWKIVWVYVPHNLHVKLFPEGTFKPLQKEDGAPE
jgi:PEGA domain